MAAEHLGFTPTTISSSQIPNGDRPFAACLMLKLFLIRTNTIRNTTFTSATSLGVIGPAAGGAEFQAAIHRWIDDTEPKGWEHQIRNDVIINYEAKYTKRILSSRYFAAAGEGRARLGTLNTKVSGGAVVMAGLFDDPWSFQHNKLGFRAYFYWQPSLNLVGYDAALQGGLLKKNSPYTIPASDISRVVFQNNVGIVIKVAKVDLEYFQSYLTKEFENGRSHYWGGLRIGMEL
jgi:hypothetical protein